MLNNKSHNWKMCQNLADVHSLPPRHLSHAGIDPLMVQIISNRVGAVSDETCEASKVPVAAAAATNGSSTGSSSSFNGTEAKWWTGLREVC